MVGSYTEDEVRVLVEEYEELRGGRSRAFVHVRLMDLDQALPRLPLKLRQAVYLHGQLGLTLRASAELVSVSHPVLLKRYQNGLTHLTKIMNGGR